MSQQDSLYTTITRLPDDPKDSSDYKKITHLELVSKDLIKYQLLNIDQFAMDKYKNIYKFLTFLNLNDNCISILKLKGYNFLETLQASNNQISVVEIDLPALRILDLSKNNIKKMFELNNLGSLRELILSQNSISEISYDAFKSVKATLNKLDMSENLIEFSNVKEFFNFTETFGMKELLVLNLENNPFCNKKKYKDFYQNLIKVNFKSLQVLNGRDIGLRANLDINPKVIKEKMLELEKKEGSFAMMNTLSAKKSEKVNLKVINKQLLKINQLGKLNDKSLEELEELVDSYTRSMGATNTSKEGENNTRADAEELDDFEIFLDYIEKIIDGISGYEKRLYAMIGKFATIKYGKFASRALSCIKQRISGENSKEIIEVLNEIHMFLKRETEENIPVSVIDSLQLFLDEPIFVNPMKTIIKRVMMIGDKIDDNLNYKGYQSENNIDVIYLNLYCGVISFLAKAIQSNDFVDEVTGNEKFIKSSAMNLKKILSESDDLIIENINTLIILRQLLYVIQVLCLRQVNEDNSKLKKVDKEDKQVNKNCINFIVGCGIRDRIEQKLRLLLQVVNKKTVFEENSKDMAQRQIQFRKKQECTSLIQCYGALLSGANDISKFLDTTSLAMKIIQIIGQKEIIDPLIMHGACDFTYFLLLNPQISADEGKFNIVAKQLQNFRCLLPFLFPQNEEFAKVCAIAEKYGEKTCDRGKPVELQYMNSEIVNNMVISISRLMSFFGRNSQNKSPISKKCVDICSEMNNLNRDVALTNCLLLPNEDVKLSIVNCFFSIQVEQLEPEELTAIYKQLTYLSSINGKMISIVAIIFIILNKWFLYHLIQKNYSKIETCKEAIFLGMNLLYKNDLTKAVYDSRNAKKTFLSAILVMFLVNVSTFEYTKKYFSEPKNSVEMNKVLQMEEISVNSINVGFPIEIEKCHCGWSINNLLASIKTGMLNPYNYVSLRVMIHAGDILLNKKYPIYQVDYLQTSDEIMKSIGEELKRREKERIKEEECNWREVKEKLKRINYENAICLNKKDLMTEQKNFVKNFRVFLEFVLCQCSEKQISQLSRVWEDKFSNDIDKIKYSTIENPIDQSIQKGDDYDNDDASLSSDSEEEKNEDKDNENEEEITVYEKFKQFLREEDYDLSNSEDKYNINFNNIHNELFHFLRYGQFEELKRDSDEETPNNPYLRSLFISAFFRCIYAVLEYPEDKSIKESMIKIIYYKDTIKILCQLAECTKFTENNIATKFLIIMRHVLRNSKIYMDQFNEVDKNKRKNEISNEFLNKIGKVSYTIRKIVRVFKKDLNIEKDEHKLLFSEVCQCSAIIISQMQMMRFVNDKVREKTISTMIDYEVINVCMLMIKEYMNKEAEMKGGANANSFGMKLLNEMVTINSNIIGEYMSRCPSRKYDILESFTRSYMFDRCKLRKSLLRDILDCSLISNVKSNLSSTMSNTMINLVAPVYLTNYHKHSSKLRLLIVTDIAFEFVEISSESEIYTMGYFNVDENLKILLEDVNAMICFDYLNRVIIQTKDNEYGFFFYKMSISSQLKSIVSEINNKVIIYDNVKTFGDEVFNDIPLAKKIEKAAENVKKNIDEKFTPLIEEEKNNNTDNGNTDGNNNNEQKENNNEDNDDNEVPIDNENKTVIINCLFEVSNFCDVFRNMFKKVELVKNAKVIVIRDNQLQIYEEKFEEWEKLNTRELFDRAEQQKDKLSGLYLGSFEHCFNYLTDYDKGDFTSMKLINGDQLVLKKNGFGGGVVFEIVDDMSYVKFKQALNLTEEFDVFETI